MPQSDKAFLTPAIIAPANRRCVILYIPDEKTHIANFWGSLLPLTQWLGWERDEEKTGRELAALWKTVVFDAWDRFERNECCGDVKPPPVQPPPVQPPIGGVAGSGVGELGYTVEELEEMLTMAITKIEVRNGSLWYRDGCCDWYEVKDSEGLGLGSLLTTSAVKPESMSLQEWVDGGKPIINSGNTPVPHENTGYNTSGALSCAKATAFLGVVSDILTATRDGLQTSGDDVSAVVEGFSSFFLIAGIPTYVLFDLALEIFTGSVGYTQSQKVDQIEAVLDVGLDTLICDLVPLMSETVQIGIVTANRATEGDYQETVKLIEAELSPGEYVMQILNTFPIQVIQENVKTRLTNQDCNCEQYLPFGYIPPLALGSLRFDVVGFVNTPTGYGNWRPVVAGQPRDLPDNSPQGQMSNGWPATEYRETANAYYQNVFAIQYRASNNAEIALGQIKADLQFLNGEPADWDWGIGVWESDNAAWVYLVGDQNDPAPIDTTIERVSDRDHVTDILVWGHCSNPVTDGAPKNVRMANIRIDGTFEGQGFLELQMGDTFTP